MFLLNIAAKSQTNLSVWGGYSWINGIIGVEAQYGHFGIGAGYLPTKIPNTGDHEPSWCGSVTYYTKSNNKKFSPALSTSFYGSIGVSSAAYRNYDIILDKEEVIVMTYGVLGIKLDKSRFSLKSGVGYGWCKEDNTITFEIGIQYRLFTNR